MTSRIVLAMAVLVGTLVIGGCGGYTLRGQAVAGDFSMLSAVASDDARLSGRGIPSVRVDLYRDPNSLGTELVATGHSGSDGSITLPIAAFGAGWMNEVWRVEVHRDGYQKQDAIIRLPRGSERLLIIMAEGRGGRYKKPDSLWDQYERYR